jgi:glucose/arabinose dehydrogenase
MWMANRLLSLLSGLLLLSSCTMTKPPVESPGEGPRDGAPDRGFTLEALPFTVARPVWAGAAPGQPDRLYIAEQGGKVWIFEGGRLLPEPYLDLSAYLTTKGNEQGLLGLAFHPAFQTNGLLFVHYSARSTGATVIASVRRHAANPDQADHASHRVILQVHQPYANHNGGWIEFGPDRMLYIALGDGGSAGDPQNRAQNLESLLGKILRIEVGDFDGYRIPPDNPLVGKQGRGEIWAWGLRNPWRNSFDPATGDLWIADVGQNEVEEIDRIPAGQRGLNFGWKILEGTKRFSAGQTDGLTPPVATYTHEEGGCSVTGGYVYRGRAVPWLVGSFIYGDYCSGKIWRLPPGGGKPELLRDTDLNLVSFGLDGQGELLLLDHQGKVYRLVR